MRYKIVEENDPDELTSSVNVWIQAGWEPQGGVSVVRYEYDVARKDYTESNFIYTQALIHRQLLP
jgi:hypothetical protein